MPENVDTKPKTWYSKTVSIFIILYMGELHPKPTRCWYFGVFCWRKNPRENQGGGVSRACETQENTLVWVRLFVLRSVFDYIVRKTWRFFWKKSGRWWAGSFSVRNDCQRGYWGNWEALSLCNGRTLSNNAEPYSYFAVNYFSGWFSTNRFQEYQHNNRPDEAVGIKADGFSRVAEIFLWQDNPW